MNTSTTFQNLFFYSNFLNKMQIFQSTKKKQIDTFDDLCAFETLKTGKFPVYIVSSKLSGKKYVMKLFLYDEENLNKTFENEARFCFLNHPNIIKLHDIELEMKTIYGKFLENCSGIFMEYAPYGNLLDFVKKYGKNFDEKLIRTYFRQIIEGLEYLHENGVSHMDLKLENLVIGEDFNLKIIDFGLSHFKTDPKILSKGTKFYRSPELIQGICYNTQACDIYSVGVILFALKTEGTLPHTEDNRVSGIDFASLLYHQNEDFWSRHSENLKKDASFFDKDFKNLFNSMVSLDPKDRFSIKDIKKSNWFNGPYYCKKELQAKAIKFLNF